jgi:hypothetical protein
MQEGAIAMNRMKWVALLIVCLLTAWTLPAHATPNLSGNWKYNTAESEDAHKKMEDALRSTRGAGGGGFGGGGGYGGGGGSFGRQHKSPQGGSNLMSPPQSMTITYNDPELRIKDENGDERVFYTDGRKTERETKDGHKMISTAKWDGDNLVIQTQPSRGDTFTETLYLTPDGKSLIEKIEFHPYFLDDAVTIRRVYDSAASDQTQTAP